MKKHKCKHHPEEKPQEDLLMQFLQAKRQYDYSHGDPMEFAYLVFLLLGLFMVVAGWIAAWFSY